MKNRGFLFLLGLLLNTTSLLGTLKQAHLAHAAKVAFTETQSTRINSHKKYPAAISYIFADLKYRDGIIKICEFGGGNNASIATSTVIYDGKTISMDTPYWPIFWQYLHQFDKPILSVGSNRAGASKHAVVIKNINTLPLNNPSNQPPNFSDRPSSISDYQGLILCNGKGLPTKTLRTFWDAHPELLFVNRESRRFGNNKVCLAELLDTPELRHLKPRWRQYKKQYSSHLAQTILADIQSNVVVIKPVNSLRAQGIIMVEAANLDKTLKALFAPDIDEQNRIPDQRDAAAYTYWKSDRNKVFMVESCESSKPIHVRGDWYNPTMRVVFVLRHEAGQIYTTILGGYWKIPPKPLTDETASLTEKYKTTPMHHVVEGYTGLKIDEKDFIQVKSIMYNALPKIYEQMLIFASTST